MALRPLNGRRAKDARNPAILDGLGPTRSSRIAKKRKMTADPDQIRQYLSIRSQSTRARSTGVASGAVRRLTLKYGATSKSDCSRPIGIGLNGERTPFDCKS